MLYQKTAMFLLIIQIHISQTFSHAIDMRDTKVFEIALDDMNYNEESENEMIQPEDLADLKPLAEDEDKYRSLHSHVKHYNERNSENKKQYSDILPYLQPHAKEIFNLEQENKPFIAGFKDELDEYFKTMKQITTHVTSIKRINYIGSNKKKKNVWNFEKLQNQRKKTINIATDKSIKSGRIKHEEINNHYGTTINEEIDFLQPIRDRNITVDETTKYFANMQETYTRYNLYEYDQENTNEGIKSILDQSTSEISTLAGNDLYEEPYDYKKFKMEYEQQLEYDIKYKKVLNYTEKEESEDVPKKALKRIIGMKRPKNCTAEELRQIGINAIGCLVYDFQHTKDMMTMKKILLRTWLVLRVWLLIYICLAIPCWCQRGWCCCCFRCKFCFPRKRIISIKRYYVMNPPGTFIKDLKKEKYVKEPIKYEPTESERDVYETFEAAIKNI